MLAPDKIVALRKILENASRVAVVSHSHPDGDAVGSSLALALYLKERLGKQAVAIFPDALPDSLDFLRCPEVLVAFEKPEESADALSSCDLLICADMNAFNRAGSLETKLVFSSAVKVLIDHHLNPDSASFALVFSETQISSASELAFWILMALEDSEDASVLPASCAEALMTGMTTDTNNFANSVFPTTLRMASMLLSAGVDRDAILWHLYNEYRENRVRAMGYFLGELLHITEDGVAYIVVTEEVRKRFDLRDGETEGFVNIPLSIGKVRMSLLLKEDDGYYRVSIRSRKGVSANRLAGLYFNGGGHECAAGGRLYYPANIASRDEAADYIEKVTARFLHEETPARPQ